MVWGPDTRKDSEGLIGQATSRQSCVLAARLICLNTTPLLEAIPLHLAGFD